MNRKKLCVTAISGNEERWAEMWSKSVMKANPDYVVINLTQYDDNTEKIIRSIIPDDKLILVKNKWEDNFSKARNQGLEHVPDDTEICCYIDMDEEFTDDSYAHIEELLQTYDGTYMPLVTIYNTLDTPGLRASLFYPRFWPVFKRGKRIEPPLHFAGSVHNQLVLGDDELRRNSVRTNIAIMHYGYSLDKETMEKKHHRSEVLIRKQIEEDSDDFFAHLNLAQLLRAKGDVGGTIEHANEVMRIVEPKINAGQLQYVHALIMAVDQLATSYLAKKDGETSLKYANIGLKWKPDHLDSIMNAANSYMEMKSYDEASYWYKRYLFIRSQYNEYEDQSNIILNHLNSSFIALYNLGIINALKGEYKLASDYFKKVLIEEPEFKDAFVKYLDTLRRTGVSQRSLLSVVNSFLQHNPNKSAMVYDYFSNIAFYEGNFELAKFNAYQAANLNPDQIEHQFFLTKWNTIRSVLGDVSMMFFDTTSKASQMKDKTLSRG